MKRIDKEICRCSKDIRRRYTKSWKWIVAGVMCSAVLLFEVEYLWLNALLLTVGWSGVAILLTIVLYYLVGDCCRPIHRPSGEMLERSELYFEESQILNIKALLDRGDLASIEKMPRSFTPDYLYVKYANKSGSIVCAQLFENSGMAPKPITEVAVVSRG